MIPRPLAIAATATGLAIAGASVPAVAQSGIFTPRSPVLSAQDPVFMGMLIGPGTNSCKRVYEPRYGWTCKYGRLPPSVARSGLGGAYVADEPKARR